MGWIGVNFDGTLAMYDGWKGSEHAGDPIKPMVELVKKWLDEGKEVKVFTARVAYDDTGEQTKFIKDWCKTHIGQELEVTNKKDYTMLELYDDLCVQMIPNKGISLLQCYNNVMENLKTEQRINQRLQSNLEELI